MDQLNLDELFNIDQVLLQSAFNPMQIALSLSITLLMAIFIYFVYKKTYNGVLYSKNFNTTLIMTALTVNGIMIGISGNIILSLGMVGALSIIRFRTAVKDPRDTAFLFWTITIGVINGVAYYELSLLVSIFIAVVLFILAKKSSYDASYVLILKYRANAYEKIEPLLKKYFKHYFVRSDSHKDGLTEKVVEVKLSSEKQDKILSQLRKIDNVDSCVLLASNGEFSE